MQSAAISHTINEALTGSAYEYFSPTKRIDDLKCIHDGVRYPFDESPTSGKEVIAEFISGDAVLNSAYCEWEKKYGIDKIKQAAFCLLGGIDGVADISSTGEIQIGEYFECGKKGACEFEGRACLSIKIADGVISKAQLRVLRLLHLTNNLIADTLFMSPNTVNRHVQDMIMNTGKSRSELIGIAAIKGIIKL